jgi:hypothetical protein
VSTPVPGWPARHEPDNTSRPADQAAVAADQAALAADRAAVAAEDAAAAASQATGIDTGGPADVIAGNQADVVVMPVDVPVPMPVEAPVSVPVPAGVGQPWTGTVIEAVPTTADEIAALVLGVPDVVRLHAGRFGEVATYLPGRRVTGIKLGDELIEVHVVIAGRVPVQQTAQAIHEAVATLVATPVHVFVEDVAAA